jgi:hypothetical protein
MQQVKGALPGRARGAIQQVKNRLGSTGLSKRGL